VLGIKEFDSLVSVSPIKKIYRQKTRIKIYRTKYETEYGTVSKTKILREELPIELLSIIVEKKGMGYFCSIKKKDFKYAVLDTNCYIGGLRFKTTAFVHERIIPLVSREYLSMLYKTYPEYSLGKAIYTDNKRYNKKYNYCDITHHKFLLVLIHAPLYNYYCGRGCPSEHRLRGNKAEQGIYFKVLIAIDDVEDVEDVK